MKWEETYQLAINFYNENGHLNIPAKFKTFDGINYDENGFALGKWIQNLRKCRNGAAVYQYLNLTEDRIISLNSIGMIWNIDEYEWKLKYQLAAEYYSSNGNLEVPAKYKTENGVALGNWINNTRCKYRAGKLEEEKIKSLEKIGMVWNIDKVYWNKMYNYAYEFYQENSHLDIPLKHKTKDGENLGIWIATQRTRYKGMSPSYTKLSDEEIEKLEQIGMIWDTRDYDWHNKYLLAKNFYEHYGHCNIPVAFKTKNGIDYDENGILLGGWITTQRQDYANIGNKDKEYEKRFNLLNKIGMIWNVRDSNWEYMYSLAEKYYQANHHLRVHSSFKTFNGITFDDKGVNLGSWIANQRLAYLQTSIAYAPLEKDKVEKLNAIGMVWDLTTDKWQRMYELAKSYYNHYGTLFMSKGFKTFDGIVYAEDGYNLKLWLRTQRDTLSGDDLTEDQLHKKDKMNELNFVWNKKENQKDIMEFFGSKNIILDDRNRVDISKYLLNEVKVKVRFLEENNLPIIVNDSLNEIFFMSSMNFEVKYNVSLQDLLEKYKNEIKK